MKKNKTKLDEKVKIFRHKFIKKICNSEDADQISGAQWLDYHYPNVNYFHPPNGGKRGESLKKDGSNYYRSAIAIGSKLKKMGAKSGVSDFIILEPINGHFGAVIELKKENGTLSNIKDDQVLFLNKCVESGYYAAVAFGYDELIRAFSEYFSGAS